jgi:hypothetical protein
MTIEARMRELASTDAPDWAAVKDALTQKATKIDELNEALRALAVGGMVVILVASDRCSEIPRR